MNEVSRQVFYDRIGHLDVTISTVGKWPYTSIFKLRHSRAEAGRVTQSKDYPIINIYFLKDAPQ